MLYILSSLLLCSFICTSSLYSMECSIEEKKPLEKSHKQRLPIPNFSILPTSITNERISSQKNSSITATFSDSRIYNSSHSIQNSKPKENLIKAFSESDPTVKNTTMPHRGGIKSLHSSSLISISPRGKSKSPRNELKLIQAVRNDGDRDIDLIKSLINNPDINPNEQDKYGNTALHHVMLKLSKDILLLKNNQINKQIIEITKTAEIIITLLLCNPEIDSTILNNHGMSAASLLQGSDFLSEIRTLVFAHDSLARWGKREVQYLLLNNYLNGTYIDQSLIEQTIKNIKTAVLKNESGGSTQMPKTAQLPVYATDEFIFKMIHKYLPAPSAKLFKIKKSSELDKINLNNLFSQVIKNLLSIEESTENILKEIRSNNAYKHLAPYITKQSISRKLILLLYNTDFLSEIPTLIFAHNILIEGIKEEIENIILDNYLGNTSIGNKTIKQSVENVKKNIYQTKSIQKQIILFPQYATDEYIFKMINTHLPEPSAKLFKIKKSSEVDKANLKELFSQEINNILFNVSITDKLIEQSVNIILKEIHSNKAYKHLAPYITKQLVLRKLQIPITQRKPDLKEIFDTMIPQETSSSLLRNTI